VDDGKGARDSDSVEIKITNVIVDPTADAGTDKQVAEGASVTLNGSKSADSDGNIESYMWMQTSGPMVTLSNPSSPITSFTAPEVGSAGELLTFELTVTDNDQLSNSDTVSVQIENINQLPIANAGSDQTVHEGAAVSLNGTASSDPDGDELSFSWTQIDGTSVVLANADTAHPSFTSPEVSFTGDVLTFELTASDGIGTDTDTIIVTVGNVNKMPVADAGADQTVVEGTSVTVNGGDSTDKDGSIASFSWQQMSGPTISISNSSSPSFTFEAPKVRGDTTLTFKLTIKDNENAISEDSVSIKVAEKVSRGNGGGRGGGGGGGGSSSITPSETSTTLPASFFLVNPLAKIIIQGTSFVDLSGFNILQASEGQQVQIVSTLENRQGTPQNLAYIVQISDEKGAVLDLEIQSASTDAGQTITLGRSWMPLSSGSYTVKVFVWDGINEAPSPLAPATERTITIA
jgi:hypothetical protein